MAQTASKRAIFATMLKTFVRARALVSRCVLVCVFDQWRNVEHKDIEIALKGCSLRVAVPQAISIAAHARVRMHGALLWPRRMFAVCDDCEC